jgi:toxin ParE1/3/4
VRVDLHPDALAEVGSIARWYEERRANLGEEFVAAIQMTLQRIGAAPESFPTWPGITQISPMIRKATVARYPYLIAFEHHKDRALVLGIAHEKRRPLYWLARGTQGPG